MTAAPTPPAKLVVLASGHGSNLQAILDASLGGVLPARVEAVIANRENAFALMRAHNALVPAIYKPKRLTQTRQEYDAELADLVASFAPDWVVLAGWLRVLSRHFLDRFPNRVVNLHPALPGAFPGLRAVERAYDAYRRGEIAQTGVMVHFVPDEAVDAGPVLAEEIVPIQPQDSLADLEARLHAVEHRLLVTALTQLCRRPEAGPSP